MKFVQRFVIACSGVLAAAGCGEDSTTSIVRTFGPPGVASLVAGANTVRISWGPSGFEGAGDFRGYNVYLDVAPVAGNDDPAFLSTRLANTSPVLANTFTVSSTAGGGSLQQGTRYYFHVRTVHANGSLSTASNELDTSPRPEGNNGSDPSQLMYDYDSLTPTKSGYGWNVSTGQGVAYSTVASNDALIDITMAEEANSPDDGSLMLSPSVAAFTAGWTQRNRTLFKDLGAGEAAWETPIPPDPATMLESVKLLEDHTYAILTYDLHWVKLRVTQLMKNVDVQRTGGGTVRLNYARFTFAVQLIQGYARF